MSYLIYVILEIYGYEFVSYNQNTIIHPQDVFGVSSQRITHTIVT